jgi:hypothetical protein
MKSLHIFLYTAVFLLINSISVYGATPGEVYKKHRQEIRQEKFNVFGGNIFIFIHSETGGRLNSKSIFRKMKVKALKNLKSKYLIYKFPHVNKLWFELYYSLPSTPKYSIKNSFVVDKYIKAGQAYLVLTVPEDQISSAKINIKKIKGAVDHAFDNGDLISLIKYSRVASGERLKKVKKEIARRAKIRLNQEKNIDVESIKEKNGNSKPVNLNKNPKLLTNRIQNDDTFEESNIDTQVEQTGDVSKNSEEKFIEEDAIRKPIDCSLPLCDELNRKKLKRDSSEKNKSNIQIKKPSNETKITIDNDLDDLL